MEMTRREIREMVKKIELLVNSTLRKEEVIKEIKKIELCGERDRMILKMEENALSFLVKNEIISVYKNTYEFCAKSTKGMFLAYQKLEKIGAEQWPSAIHSMEWVLEGFIKDPAEIKKIEEEVMDVYDHASKNNYMHEIEEIYEIFYSRGLKKRLFELLDEYEKIKIKREVEKRKENNMGVATHLLGRTLFAFNTSDLYSAEEVVEYELGHDKETKAYGIIEKDRPDLFLGHGDVTLVGKPANVYSCYYRDIWSLGTREGVLMASNNPEEAEVEDLFEAARINSVSDCRGHCEVFSYGGWAEKPICLVNRGVPLSEREREVIKILKEKGIEIFYTTKKEVKEMLDKEEYLLETAEFSSLLEENEFKKKEKELADLIPANCGISLWD
jgi:hypothetical protein